jgi:hypothetical protein
MYCGNHYALQLISERIHSCKAYLDDQLVTGSLSINEIGTIMKSLSTTLAKSKKSALEHGRQILQKNEMDENLLESVVGEFCDLIIRSFGPQLLKWVPSGEELVDSHCQNEKRQRIHDEFMNILSKHT